MKTPLTAAMCCLAWYGAATAQTWELSASRIYPRFSGTPLGSISEEEKKEDDTTLKGLYGYGVRLTRNTKGYYGHEIGFNYNYARVTAKHSTKQEGKVVTTTLQDRILVRQAYYDFLMYCMPNGERWRPYIAVGVQGTDYAAPDLKEWPTGKSRNYGFNYGGGIKLRLLRNVYLRLDVRDHWGGKPYDLEREDVTKSGGRLRLLEGSAGISLGF
jgi:opacity protein-like surface antigen